MSTETLNNVINKQMPQTSGKISWATNSRIKMPEKRIRTGNLNLRLENISLKSDMKRESSMILDQKYRNQANRDFEIGQMKQDAEQLFYQVKMTKELGGKWSDLVRAKSSFETRITNTDERLPNINKDMSRSKSAVTRVSFNNESSDKPKHNRSIKSAVKSRSRSNSIVNVDSYTRSYKYLRDLVHFDGLTRERFQRFHDRRIANAKKNCDEVDAQLHEKIKHFLTDVDDFVVRTKLPAFTSNEASGNSSNEFIDSLKMPDFHVLND